MKKILITGGPVHAKLDAIKFITNGFRGGRMVDLALKLMKLGYKTTYLTAKQTTPEGLGSKAVLLHDGFHDYMKQVVELAPEYDAVILGAAVANLIPLNPWEGKFPSHDYKPGDVIPIDFTIAPRVIDEVKKANPNTHLFGFKLLKGVGEEELISAAYDLVLESRASAMFANDANNLDRKLVVTKEHAVQDIIGNENLAKFICEIIEDEYYSTNIWDEFPDRTAVEYLDINIQKIRAVALAKKYASWFQKKYGKRGYRFGTIAVKAAGPEDVSFITTVRGKEDLNDWTYVRSVNHETKVVTVEGAKATLNAPLLHYLFDINPECRSIIHSHETNSGLPIVEWAPPGTMRDSCRVSRESFEIEHHGTFLLLGDNNELLK